jgi:hypothetical protein
MSDLILEIRNSVKFKVAKMTTYVPSSGGSFTGAVAVGGNLSTSAELQAATAALGPTTCTTLSVNGVSITGNPSTVGSYLPLTGGTVSGNTDFQQNVTVTGTVNAIGGVQVNGVNLSTNFLPTTGGSVTGNISVTGNQSVSGTSTLTTVNATTVTATNLNFTNMTAIDNAFTITGNPTVLGTLNANDIQIQGVELTSIIESLVGGGGGGSGSGTVTTVSGGNSTILVNGTAGGTSIVSAALEVNPNLSLTSLTSSSTIVASSGINTLTNDLVKALKTMFNGLLYPELQSTLSGAGTVGSPYTFTDNTSGIQTCFNLLSAAQGGQIVLSSSQYNTSVPINPVTNSFNQSIRGVSQGYDTGPLKTFQPTTGSRILGTLATGPVFVVNINPALMFEKMAIGFPVTSFTCQQGPFVSYATNANVSSGIVWTGTSSVGGGTDQGLVRDVNFVNCMSGIEVSQFGNWDTMIIDRINTDGCVCGITINAAIFFSRIINSIFADMPYWGVNQNGGSGSQGNAVVNNSFARLCGTSNTDIDTLGLGGHTARGMVIDTAIYSRIVNNTFTNPGQWIFATSSSGSTTVISKMQLAWCVILNQSQSCVISGNQMYMAGFGQANANCINILNTSTQWVITGNSINAFSQGIIVASGCNYGTISGNSFQFQNNDIIINSNYVVIQGNSFQASGASNGLAVSNPCSITINGNHNVIGPNTYLSGVGGQPDIIINSGATSNAVTLIPGMSVVDNGTGTVFLNYALVTASLCTVTGTDATRLTTST